MQKRCETCGQIINNKRSVDISNHLHAHITQTAMDTARDRNYVYMCVLLLACEIEVDGGAAYPYTIVDDVLYPHRTTNRTNKQMMTAVEAAHMYAVTVCDPPVTLRETEYETMGT